MQTSLKSLSKSMMTGTLTGKIGCTPILLIKVFDKKIKGTAYKNGDVDGEYLLPDAPALQGQISFTNRLFRSLTFFNFRTVLIRRRTSQQ